MISAIAYQMQSGKKYFLIIAALVFSLILVLTGCDGSSNDSSGGKAPSEEVTLSDLSVSSGSLSPSFSSGTTSYTASVAYGATSITVTPTAAAPDDVTITVNGTTVSSGDGCGKALSEGQNTFEIVVTGKTTSASLTYTVVVTVLSDDTDVTLSGLSISAGSLSSPFSSGTTSYAALVANDVITTTVTPTATSPGDVEITVNGTTVTSGSPSDSINLPVGNNTINVVVTSSINSEKTTTYTIIVTRAGADPTGSLDVEVNFTSTVVTPSAGNILYIDIFYSQSSLLNWANDVTGTVTSDASSQVTLSSDDIDGGVTETFTGLDTGADALYVCAFVDLNSNGSLDDDELVEFYEDTGMLDALYWAAGSGGAEPTSAKGSSSIIIDLDNVFEFPGGGVISYSIDGGATVVLTEVVADYSNLYNDTYIRDINSEIIGFYFPGSSTGFFDQGDEAVDFFVADSGNDYWMSGATSINVTQYGAVGGNIVGNFSCVLTNVLDSSDTITVTGTFSVLRVVDYD